MSGGGLKLTVERDHALAALAKVAGVVEARTTIPILQDLLIEAGAFGLRLTGTDLDMTASAVLSAQVDQGGRLTANASRLHEIFRAMPPGAQVGLTHLDGRLAVQCGRSRYQLATLDPDQFPQTEAEAGGVWASLEAPGLARMLDKVGPAMSVDATRYYLCGLFLHVVDGQLVAVATDGARLARMVAPLPEGFEALEGVILPRKAVMEVRRLIGDMIGPVEVWTNGRLFRVSAGATALVTKLIDATFPDYQRVIPQGNPHKVACDQTDLASAIKRVMIVSEGKVKAVRLALSASEAVLSARDGDGGEGEAVMAAVYDGPDRAFSFNGRLLADVVAGVSGETVAFEIGTESDPVRVGDPSDPSVTFVLMPLRV